MPLARFIDLQATLGTKNETAKAGGLQVPHLQRHRHLLNGDASVTSFVVSRHRLSEQLSTGFSRSLIHPSSEQLEELACNIDSGHGCDLGTPFIINATKAANPNQKRDCKANCGKLVVPTLRQLHTMLEYNRCIPMSCERLQRKIHYVVIVLTSTQKPAFASRDGMSLVALAKIELPTDDAQVPRHCPDPFVMQFLLKVSMYYTKRLTKTQSKANARGEGKCCLAEEMYTPTGPGSHCIHAVICGYHN